jgi:glycosyltransferase involved in cell wall biosynthesis
LGKTGMEGFPVFLWVGRLNPNKDPVTVVKAFLQFVRFHADARLYMIYQTDELLSELTNLVQESGYKKNVEFVGRIQHNQLLYWFNSADFYLSASHYEGSGTALSEAMSCGCIPIVTDIPSFRMICQDAGLFFEPGDEAGLLTALLKTRELDRNAKRFQALERFKNELSFEAISRKFQEIAGSLY